MKLIAIISEMTSLRVQLQQTKSSVVSIVPAVALAFAVLAPVSAECFEAGKEIIAFADFLYDSGDYLRAATEYKRYIFLFPEGKDVERAGFRTGLSYQRSGNPRSAIVEFNRLIRTFPESRSLCAVKFEIGRTYFLSGDYESAGNWFGSLSDPAISRDARYGLGWSLFEMGRWTEASDAFSGVSPEMSEWAAEGTNLPRKSPILSATLSVLVPGGGQVYCGRLGDGFYSLFLSGGFSLASLLSIRDGNRERGYLLGVAALGFYAGNIYGAALAAIDFNTGKISGYIRAISERARSMGLHLSTWEPKCLQGTAK